MEILVAQIEVSDLRDTELKMVGMEMSVRKDFPDDPSTSFAAGFRACFQDITQKMQNKTIEIP